MKTVSTATYFFLLLVALLSASWISAALTASWISTCFATERQNGGSQFNPMVQFDTDGDNRLSQDEFPGPDTHFQRFDSNGDGYLEPDELPKGPPPGRQGDPGRRSSGSNVPPGMQGNGNGGPAGSPIDQFDTDGDNKLSKEEFPGPDDHFQQFDRNNNGYLEEDEMPSGPPPESNRQP